MARNIQRVVRECVDIVEEIADEEVTACDSLVVTQLKEHLESASFGAPEAQGFFWGRCAQALQHWERETLAPYSLCVRVRAAFRGAEQ